MTPAEIAALLRRGGIAIYPTETFYALGADPRSPEGVAAVFRAKGRPPDRALPWIAADREQVASVAVLTPVAEKLARRWPGPLTLVLDRRDGAGTVAIRVSAHPLARAVARELGHPVISTSANRSGAPPAVTAAAAALPGVPALDGGTTPGGAPSAIVDATGPVPVALRGRIPDSGG